jgi:hypothetical protein
VVTVREAATGRCRVVAVVLPGQVADVRRALRLAGLDAGQPGSAGVSTHVTTHRPPAALLALLRPHVLVAAEEHLRAGLLALPEARRGQRARLVVIPTSAPFPAGHPETLEHLDVPAVAEAVRAAATVAALQRWGLGYLDVARAAGLGAPGPAGPPDGELLLARLRTALGRASGPVAEQVAEAARLARGAAARHGLPALEQRAVQEAAALVAGAPVAQHDPTRWDATLNDPTLIDPTLIDPSLNDPTLNDPTLNDPSPIDPSRPASPALDAALADPREHPAAHLARAAALLAVGELVPVVAALGELGLHEAETAGTADPGGDGLEQLPVHAALVVGAVRAVRTAWAGTGYDVAGRLEPPALPHLLDTLA